LSAGVLVIAGATGCASSGSNTRGRDPALRQTRITDAEWPFWPYRMRIHPLSHFVKDRDSGDLLIETRIEFEDAEGNTCKGVGLIGIELYSADVEQFVSSEAISSWSTDLGDLDVNRDHYDDVTRTYLFRLEVEDVDLPDQPELRAYFTSRDGAHLQATYKLPTPP
jgi:hypothetical protein